MPPDFESHLHKFAEVIVRVGLNLQRGQRLLIAEPYELQGVARDAETTLEAIKRVSGAAVEVIWGDAARLRKFAEHGDWHGFAELTAKNAARMESYVRNGDAILFLIGSHPELLRGVRAEDAAELRRIAAESFGGVAHHLTRGATNWTAVPAPNREWADHLYAEQPAPERLGALWGDVFRATRADLHDPLARWTSHLQNLARERDALDQRRVRKLRYVGEGTDLTLELPEGHRWCTAQLKTRFGVPFVANLPTEEIFTAPHKDSAHGHVRVARPVHYTGRVIEGLELAFAQGRIVDARARRGAELLEHLLATDEGACRLGEVAILPTTGALHAPSRAFGHTLLDENAGPHIALGEAYDFCHRTANADALNRSLIHIDLPLNARFVLEPN